MCTVTSVVPVRSTIRARAASPRSRLRATRPTSAPSAATRFRGGETYSRSGAGDDDDAAVELWQSGGAPRGAAQSIAEVRVAGDDAVTQQGVEPGSRHSVQRSTAYRSSASRRASREPWRMSSTRRCVSTHTHQEEGQPDARSHGRSLHNRASRGLIGRSVLTRSARALHGGRPAFGPAHHSAVISRKDLACKARQAGGSAPSADEAPIQVLQSPTDRALGVLHAMDAGTRRGCRAGLRERERIGALHNCRARLVSVVVIYPRRARSASRGPISLLVLMRDAVRVDREQRDPDDVDRRDD